MMILGKPAISPYLSKTLAELAEPVVFTDSVRVPMKSALNELKLESLKKNSKAAYESLILTNLENALAALYNVIPFDERILKSRIFKNKIEFRRAISREFPDFFFKEVKITDLDSVSIDTFPFPLILKPASGISSIGVYRVETKKDWREAVHFLRSDIAHYQKNYRAEVVESTQVILEEYIEGPELAIDGYFDSNGEPVILNILEHLFDGPKDTSDRVYFTRRSIIKKYLKSVTSFCKRLSHLFDLKRFPFHLEVRVQKDGSLTPIELNPLRFSGLGTTEIAEYAYNINVYRFFFRQMKPDWEKILKQSDDSVYAFTCADVPTEFFKDKTLSIDDRKLVAEFEEILEYRILPETETSTFAVIFFRSQTMKDCQKLLKLDFKKYLSLSKPR